MVRILSDMETTINTLRWDEFTTRERKMIDDALRIYLGEIRGNCAAAFVGEDLRAELAAVNSIYQPGESEDDMEQARR